MFFREYTFDSYSFFFFFVLNFHFLRVPRKLFPFYFHIERYTLFSIPSTLSCSVSRFLCTSRLKGFRVIPLSSCRGKVFTHILWYCSTWYSTSGRYGSSTLKFRNEYSCGRMWNFIFYFSKAAQIWSEHIFVTRARSLCIVYTIICKKYLNRNYIVSNR